MNGLAVYGGSDDDDDDGRHQPQKPRSAKPITIKKPKIIPASSSRRNMDTAKPRSSPQRNPTSGMHLETAMPALKLDARAKHLVSEPGPSHSPLRPPMSRQGTADEADQAAALRRLLEPPQIPGVDDWGIPPESDSPCDPQLVTKVIEFHAHKQAGKHYNDSLMQSRLFRNPHIHAKLVQYVDIQEESGTNFPKDVWDPFYVKDLWFADQLAAKQKERSTKTTQAQASGQRTKIAFESAGSGSTSTTTNSKGKERERERHHPYDGRQGRSRWDDSREQAEREPARNWERGQSNHRDRRR